VSFVADLHLHSSYAYATSKALTLENLAAWAQLKGIDLLATADFTHPVWFEELRQKLTPESDGLYSFQGTNFVLGTEVSCVFSQGGRSRRVHVLIFAPGLDTVARLNEKLSHHGKLEPDGRPTLGLSARDLTALTLDIDPQCLIIPAHVWTPWYGMYGSKSGFNRLEECFLDMAPHVHAIETGLSSDPAMNWSVAELMNRTIVSFSDAHSLPKLARELTVFDGDVGYSELVGCLLENRVAYTVEFYPEEGKYHFDGHRKCGVRLSPDETARQGERCPVCGRPLTLGVWHRTKTLSGKVESAVARDSDGFIRSRDGRPPFVRLIPLQEIISEVRGNTVGSQRVQREYHRIVGDLGSELRALLLADAQALVDCAGEDIARGVIQSRMGEVVVEPGYDGVFGKVTLPTP
jgi:uncharacterized protein (TIGR00375 family)